MKLVLQIFAGGLLLWGALVWLPEYMHIAIGKTACVMPRKAMRLTSGIMRRTMMIASGDVPYTGTFNELMPSARRGEWMLRRAVIYTSCCVLRGRIAVQGVAAVVARRKADVPTL
jgi:hypothetical protein